MEWIRDAPGASDCHSRGKEHINTGVAFEVANGMWQAGVTLTLATVWRFHIDSTHQTESERPALLHYGTQLMGQLLRLYRRLTW
jgi:hypothetical protein